MNITSTRMRFTDALVVCVVGVMLLTLVLPATNLSRELAKNDICANRIQKLATGCSRYESIHGNLPPGLPHCNRNPLRNAGTQAGNFCAGPTWALAIMHLVGNEGIHQDTVDCLATSWNVADDCVNNPLRVGRTTPDILICPVAPKTSLWHNSILTRLESLAKGNYVACHGSWKYAQSIEGGPAGYSGLNEDAVPSNHTVPTGTGPSWEHAIGAMSVTRNSLPIPGNLDRPPPLPPQKLTSALPAMFGSGNGVKLRRITDGLSKTAMISEMIAVESEIDGRGVWMSGMMGGASFTTLSPPNAESQETMVHPLWNGFTIDFVDKFFSCDRRAHLQGENLRCFGSGLDGNEWAAARSAHKGGVNVGFVDGKVGFISNDVDYLIWHAMGSRAGGRVGGEMDK